MTSEVNGGTQAQDSIGGYFLSLSGPVGGVLNRFRSENCALTFVNGKLTVTDLGNYRNSSSIAQVSGSAVGASQDGVPRHCERQKFTKDMGSTGRDFLRISVMK